MKTQTKLSFVAALSLMTTTDNGAVSHAGSGSALVDLFNQGATLRTEEEMKNAIGKAWKEDPILATKIVMHLRDVRNGQGRRDILQAYLNLLECKDTPKKVAKILVRGIVEIGSWKDLMKQLSATSNAALKKAILKRIKKLFYEDGELLHKWLPRELNSIKNKATACNHFGLDPDCDIEDLYRVAKIRVLDKDGNIDHKKSIKVIHAKHEIKGITNPSSILAREIAEYLGLTMSEYRKEVSKRTKVVEQKMSSGLWHTIDYSKDVASLANLKYSSAFLRNDESRRREFLEQVTSGETKMNSSVAYVHDMVYKIREYRDDATMDAMYKSYPKTVNKKNVLTLVDTSGSMQWANIQGTQAQIWDVAVGMGILFAEQNTGEYKDFCMVFAGNPVPHKFNPTDTLSEKVRSLPEIHQSNTDINKVFDYILQAAKVTPEDTPATVLILSDMQFDSCMGDTSVSNFQHWRKQFEDAGLELPQVVFWQLNASNNNTPVTINDAGVVLVGGYSPSILQSVLSLEVADFNPYDAMVKIITPLYPWVDKMFKVTD